MVIINADMQLRLLMAIINAVMQLKLVMVIINALMQLRLVMVIIKILFCSFITIISGPMKLYVVTIYHNFIILQVPDKKKGYLVMVL